MHSRVTALFLTTTLLALTSSPALAHFIWIVNENGVIQVHFNESCEPGDAALLDKVTAAKIWAFSKDARAKQPVTDVTAALANSQLSAKLPEKMGILALSHDYGVLTKNEKTFLLRYYAKTYSGAMPGDWKELNNPEKLALEITPKWQGKELQLKVTWKGRPAKGAEVTVHGCGLDHVALTTNEAGIASCAPTTNGLLSVRTKQEEAMEGMLEGKPYTSIRSYSTLSLPLSVPLATPIAHQLPELAKGITSFGAAIAGDDLYVYGGHFGSAHHYSHEGQSNEFKRVSLTAEKPQWETLPEGPKLTGLALVAHDGKLYRVGGFTAQNDEKAEQDLRSQAGFAMYDPATKAWTELPPMPEGRSSHDAAVLDGKLYVVGGWKLQGKEPTIWHKSVIVCDLKKDPPQWEEIASPPFQRRALSVAAFHGKLYAIGGMEESGSISMRVDCFDPAKGEWSAGPLLLGSGMDGFGTSAFANQDALVVTTMSGTIERLNSEGKQWELVGQLSTPRFFHRQIAAANGDMVILGGASMETGKVNSFERFAVGK